MARKRIFSPKTPVKVRSNLKGGITYPVCVLLDIGTALARMVSSRRVGAGSPTAGARGRSCIQAEIQHSTTTI